MNQGAAASDEIEVERAKLEPFRQQFAAQTALWLQGWFRQCAYGYATKDTQNSLALGGEGLRQFRLEVEALIGQADQIVACFLNDEIWWHVDPYMSRSTVVYSVRLCMGRLLHPLSRFGFVKNYHWREAEKISVRRPVQRGGEIECEEEIEFHPVATNRPFFRCDDQDKALRASEWSTEEWSAPMLAALCDYFKVVDRVKELTWNDNKQREAEAKQQREQAVRQALAFASLTGSEDAFMVPKTSSASLEAIFRGQHRTG